MYRYQIVEISRADTEKREETLWEMGRSGWELVQIVSGSDENPEDKGTLSLWFKRAAEADIGL
ncbi:MAG: hypothetical protein ACYTDX_01005 [Planctomycetota bacterium]